MDIRSRYLSSAARLYSTTSPSTSAHLMSERLELDSTSEKKPKPDSAPICLACGTILIPGLTSRKTTKSHRKPTKQLQEGLQATETPLGTKIKKSKVSRGPLETVIVEECLACWRSVIHPLPAAQKRPRGVIERSQGVTGQGSLGMEKGSRSRSRKKRPTGLLDKAKEEEEKAKAERGFDLMDFMRAV
ncbi:hypothetical protein MMC10_003733 [Thelotrema lepadinum]|nr:hypothetical protein [Thelotrema lepadinum]